MMIFIDLNEPVYFATQGPNASRNRDCHVGCDRFRLPGFLDGSWYLNVEIPLMLPVPPRDVSNPRRQLMGFETPQEPFQTELQRRRLDGLGYGGVGEGPCWGCQG